MSELQPGEEHRYQVGKTSLVIGTPMGHKRPALWVLHPTTGEMVILARFYGGLEATTAIELLDAMIDEINRAIRYLEAKYKHSGETPET